MKEQLKDQPSTGLPAMEDIDGGIVQMRNTTLDALAAHVALIDEQGIILAVNEAWRRFASNNGLPGADCCVGQSYLDVCERAVGEGSEEARKIANGIRHLLKTGNGEFQTEYACDSPGRNIS